MKASVHTQVDNKRVKCNVHWWQPFLHCNSECCIKILPV